MVIKCNKIPSDKDWKRLSIFGSKKNYFNTETYFRESWFDGYQEFSTDFTNKLTRLAVVVLKPEVFAARRARDVLMLIERHNFKLRVAYKVKYNRHKIRETWRYQYSEATIDRMSLVDHLYCLGDAMMVIFEDVSPEITMPASARLHKLKGASEERLRTAESLRSIVKIPNGVVRFFHIPDEPADIVREFGILFDRQNRFNIYQDIKSSLVHDYSFIDEMISTLESQHTEHDFCLAKSWDNILSNIHGYKEDKIELILDLKNKVDAREEVGWEDIYKLLSSCNCNIYDIITIASHVIKQDVDDEFHLIDGDALRGWDSRYFSNL
ncbi:nucleoside-diphosphate kinase [Serratia oryzae]|uniref:Uncharacterized protein n=1 Tax=Serratia oryzae TaxID=2034155 RepID=A0A1S8CGQ3_9GAMM|nr:nucleoside-diphosphate kinase [Serratia oryzae]OMQ20872.1 hypothetical protein BMI79_17320 [Serratia oryzae]